MSRFKDELMIIADELDDNDIEINFSDNGFFVFTNKPDFEDAQNIIEDIVGPFSYMPYEDILTIRVLPAMANESKTCEQFYNVLNQDFNRNKILKEDYESDLKLLKEYLEDIKNSDVDIEEELLSEENLEETYSDEELDNFKNKVFNQQKILSIYRKKKYGDDRLFAHTRCINCGREKKVFLSNLVNDPDKYGSCICSDTNIESRMDNIEDLYKGTKKLASNTSGYTGVTFVKTYRGEPYNKWRAYIEVDGKRTYLGDFNSKSKAIKARRAAGRKGIKWYKDNKNQFMATARGKAKRYRTRRTRRFK